MTSDFLKTGRRKMCPTFGGEKGRREYRAKIILKGRQGENAKTTSVATENEARRNGRRVISILFHLIYSLSITSINCLSKNKSKKKGVASMSVYIH